VISLFFGGQRRHEMPPGLSRNSIKILFGYLDDIQTQKGDSDPMDSLFLFFQSRIFRDFNLTPDFKIR
jgi:hypothetical protein